MKEAIEKYGQQIRYKIICTNAAKRLCLILKYSAVRLSYFKNVNKPREQESFIPYSWLYKMQEYLSTFEN
jgi:hypothetical protein